LTRTDGTLADIDRVLDVRNNRYRERVVLADGTKVRDIDEPLTEHFDRGSAKPRSTD
jgi:hypothetical protein